MNARWTLARLPRTNSVPLFLSGTCAGTSRFLRHAATLAQAERNIAAMLINGRNPAEFPGLWRIATSVERARLTTIRAKAGHGSLPRLPPVTEIA